MAQTRYYSSTARNTILVNPIDAAATQIVVAEAAGYPSLFPFTLILDRDTIDEEVVECTAASGDTFTITRGVDGTGAITHSAGATVEHGVSARDFRESDQHRSNTENVHGLSLGSQLVGTIETQTMTNKTLAAPILIGADANGSGVHNVADPVVDTDAANKRSVVALTGNAVNAAAASAAAALVSEQNAEASEIAAAISEQNAANSAAAAAAALDSFDDRYLGSKSTFPTVDNDGNPLLSGALFYLNTAPDPDDVGMYVYDGLSWLKASAAATKSFIAFEYTAADGQTVFTGNDNNGVALVFTADLIQVFLNGVLLHPGEDYTSSTNTVTLASGAALDDAVLIAAFSSFDVANTYTKSQADAKFALETELAGVALDFVVHEAEVGDTHGVAAGDQIVGGNAVNRIVKLTQAQYDGLTPVATTLYVIVG